VWEGRARCVIERPASPSSASGDGAANATLTLSGIVTKGLTWMIGSHRSAK
jgi:hypothetical protein